MRKAMISLFVTGTLFFTSGIAHADPYSDCMDKCGKEYSDCMAEPQASEPEQQTAKEAACSEKSSTCYFSCENLKPASKDSAPEGDTDSPQAAGQQI